MGICHAEQFQSILKHHKEQIRRYIVQKKGQEFLQRELTKAKRSVSELTQKYEAEHSKLITDQYNKLAEFNLRLKKELDVRQPGGIKSLQQMKKKNIDELLGFRYIQGLFGQLRNNVQLAFREEQLTVMSQLVEIKQKQQIEYDSEFISSILQTDISANQRQTIEEKLGMQFHSEVSAYQEILFENFRESFSLENYEKRLQNIESKEQICNLLGMAKQKLQISMNIILGQKIDIFIVIQ